jgi:hypothetical protein
MQISLRYAALIVNMKVTVFWIVTLSNPVKMFRISEVVSAAIVRLFDPQP